MKNLVMYYLQDRDNYRVWRNDWAGDMFEVLDKTSFNEMMKICQRFGILFVNIEED